MQSKVLLRKDFGNKWLTAFFLKPVIYSQKDFCYMENLEAQKRNDIYKLIGSNGLKVGGDFHDQLKKLLKDYAEHRASLILDRENAPLPQIITEKQPRTQYLFICKNCRSKKYAEGKKEKLKVIGNKFAAKVEQTPIDDSEWEKNLEGE